MPTRVLSDLDVRELNEELTARYGLKGLPSMVWWWWGSSPEARRRKWVCAKAILFSKSIARRWARSSPMNEPLPALPRDQAVLLLLKRKGQTIYLTLRP